MTQNLLVQNLLEGKYDSSNQNFSIVPIVGMGGVGKTTLARLLYDEKEVKDHFEVRAWVCVSDEFSVSNISKVIYQSVSRENKEFTDLNLLQEALKEKLKNKLFLIVLDDVWSESYDDWEKLVGPFRAGAPGSRIILTTRKEQLLRKLGYAYVDPLSSLSHDDALSLFAQHALVVDNFDSHPTLKPHGAGFVKKCDGLPLALRSLGRLLRTKIDEEEWKELLDSEIWRLGRKDEIVPALRLSYNDLSASLKQLFAYCCLFPKDYEFDKEELVLLWMAEGFLHQSTTSKSMKRFGLEYFEELLSRPFFQHSSVNESLFVMHDLMNDLAMSVAGDLFSRLDIGMRKEFTRQALQKHRRMSFVCEKYMVYQRYEPLRGAKSLRTFLALSIGAVESLDTFYLSNKVLDDLLQELPLLRVLSLSRLRITEVPEVVGSMKHLRYLNLSRTLIKQLPENVCNLYNLQTLIVSGCDKLIKLPESFSKLKNLQHLEMWDTPLLKKIPLGIGELKSLQTLSNVVIGGENGLPITELKNLKNLHGEISIWGLGNVRNAVEAPEANLSEKKLSDLVLGWGDVNSVFQACTHAKEVLNELKPHIGTLKTLTILSYPGKGFPNWVGDPSFLWLTHLMIHGCEKCTSLPSLGQLPSLKELIIGKMSKVKVVGWDPLGTGLLFPSLEILRFLDMEGWEVWSTKSGDVDATLPCLQELSIEYCPNLVELSLKVLPSLRILKLRHCGHSVLTSLVDVASSLTKLEICDIIGLNDYLWRGVIEYIRDIKILRIELCNEIRFLWESDREASKVLVNLGILVVHKCENLVSLGENDGDVCGSNLSSLRDFEVRDCNSLEHCSCPDSIEAFTIGGCVKLLKKEWGGSMQMLKSVNISGWSNLKSITELSCFNQLRKLKIRGCPNMESFPDHELLILTSLTYFAIHNCPSMDASFPRGFWPPKLFTLEIGRLRKPISQWGEQNFPTSLNALVLYGGPCDDVNNSGELSYLLPVSLTYLRIDGFEKLELVSTGLQHLTSLQRLIVYNCPQMIDLPEKFLSSLLILIIEGCPKLKERINRGGSYWPLISLIPYFRMDGEL